MENQYYILKPAVGTKETGMTYPAIESFEDYDFNALNSVYKLKSHIQSNANIDFRFKLAKNAKLTDLLSQATIKGAGILLSENLFAFLQNYKLIPYQIFDVQILAKETILNYKYLHFIWEDWYQCVNWEISTFRLFEDFEFSPIEINSYQEYLEEVDKSEFLRITPDKITFFDFNFDLFNHPFIGENLISEKLKGGITSANNFTGIDISPSNV